MYQFTRAAAAALAIVIGISLAIADEPKQDDGASGDAVQVEITTSEGNIVLELDAKNAPISVKNFLSYIEKKHYEGTVFHRVIDGFMVQGGGLDTNLKEKPTQPPIKNESNNGLKNVKYSVAMARVGSDPNSATSQFFINVADNGFLNREESSDGFGYAVFGKVVKGQEVVDKISKAPTQTQPNPAFPPQLMQNVPVSPIVLKSANVLVKKGK